MPKEKSTDHASLVPHALPEKPVILPRIHLSVRPHAAEQRLSFDAATTNRRLCVHAGLHELMESAQPTCGNKLQNDESRSSVSCPGFSANRAAVISA
jgi:hypothetical protein